MRTLSRMILCAGVALAAWTPPAGAQPAARTTDRPAYTSTEDLNDVRPFQSWIQDAVVTEGIDLEPVLEFANRDFGNSLFAGARVASWVRPDLEVGARFGVVRTDPESVLGMEVEGETGASDLLVHARYLFPRREGAPQVSVGGGLDLPIGEEAAGQGSADFTAFVAARYEIAEGVELLGNAGLESLEVADGRENGLRLGGGAILPLTDDLAALAEFVIGTAGEFAAVSGGLDLELPPGGHLRAGIALGLDDGAPDYQLLFGLAVPVY